MGRCTEIYSFRHKPQRPTPRQMSGDIRIRAECAVVEPPPDTSLCFDTSVIIRADNTSRLVEEYARMFLRKYLPQRLPPKPTEFTLSAPIASLKKVIGPSCG